MSWRRTEERRRSYDLLRWYRVAVFAVIGVHAVLALWLAVNNLRPTDFYDEWYNVENALSILDTGSLHPSNSYYAPPSYLPQTALLWGMDRLSRASGAEWLAPRETNGSLSDNGRIAVRLVVLLWGALAIWLTAELGRRLFSPACGATAAALLAGTPWAIRGLVEFKPDSLLLATTLIAMHWVLDAVESPTGRRFARAGAGLGLATATKLNGAFLAPVVALAALLVRGETRWRQRLAWIAGAGATAIGVYSLLSPWVSETLWYLKRNVDHYDMRGAGVGASEVAWQLATDLVSPDFHGRIVGVLAVVGMAAGAAFVLWHRRAAPPALAVVLSYPPVYVAAYLASTHYYKPNNFLQLLPFTALAAAASLWFSLRRAGSSRRVASSAVALAGVGLLALGRGTAWTYDTVIPTTKDAVVRELLSDINPIENRTGVFVGPPEEAPAVFRYRDNTGKIDWLSWRSVDRLEHLSPQELDLADCELVATNHGSADDIRILERASAAGGVQEISPRPFLARGHEHYRLRVHPWKELGDPVVVPLTSDSRARAWRATLPGEVSPGEIVSVEVVAADVDSLTLSVDHRPMALSVKTSLSHADVEATSGRFRVGHPAAPIELDLMPEASLEAAAELAIRVHRWHAS